MEIQLDVTTPENLIAAARTVTFGITGDFAANPDLDVLAHGIEDGISELLKAAHR